MSEFDLIPHHLNSDSSEGLPWTWETVTANLGVPFLDLRVGQVEPGPEIPGLQLDFSPTEPTPTFLVSASQGLTISFRGQSLLCSQGHAQLKSVELEDLPGLKTRTGDGLPKGYSKAVSCKFGLTENSKLYGLGQRSGPLERRRTAPVNWTTDEASGHHRTTDPLYQAHPLLWGTDGRAWWAALLLHSAYSRFDLGQTEPDTMEWLTLGTGLRVLLHAGRTPEEVYRSLSQVLLPPPLPPLWALGFHQSRWGYRDQSEVKVLVESFQKKGIPLDAVHLDIDHMEEYRSFTFSKERFPDPEALFHEWRDLHGVRAVTIIDPGLKFDSSGDYPPLSSGLNGGHFLKTQSGAPLVGYCWPDEALFPDYSRSATRSWWAKQVQFYLDAGVAGIWIDMNEPAVFDRPFWSGQARQHPFPLDLPSGEDEAKVPHLVSRNLYGSNMAKATQAAWTEREERPWILTRSGFTGVGAHAWSWMGDNTSWWEHLQLSLPQLSSMGLVGSPFVGVDIGGFFGHCDGELYSAWIEASPIYPFMRAHSALGTREQHPWSFGSEVEEVARTAIRLRYRLLPYLYSCAQLVSKGESPPLLRPMFFDYPDHPVFETMEDQVMLGSHLLAAPFLKRGQTHRLVHFPPGQWTDLHSARQFEGDQAYIIERRPGLVPLFAQAGAIISMLPEDLLVGNTRDLKSAPWQLLCCPGRDGLKSVLYDDDGLSKNYQEGHFWRADLTLQGDQVRLLDRQGKRPKACRPLIPSAPSSEGWKALTQDLDSL